MKKKIGSLDKVSVITLVKYHGEDSIPVVYTEATNSLNLPSATRVIEDRDAPSVEYKQFENDPKIGLAEIEKRYLRDHHIGRLHKFYDTSGKEFREKHGKVRKMTQDLHYRGFEVDEPLKAEDFGDNVKFIPLDELMDKIENADDLNEIRIVAGGKSYRVNRGVINGVKELEKERKRKGTSHIIGVILCFV